MSGMQKKAFHDDGTDTAVQPFNKVGGQKCQVKNKNIWRKNVQALGFIFHHNSFFKQLF